MNNEERNDVTATGNSTMNTQFVPQIDSSFTLNATIDYVSTPQQHLNDRTVLSQTMSFVPVFSNQDRPSTTTLTNAVHLDDRVTMSNIQTQLPAMVGLESLDIESNKISNSLPTTVAPATFTTLQPVDYHFL